MFAYYSKFLKNFSSKIYQVNHNEIFLLPPAVLDSFQKLKEDLKNAMLVMVDYDEGFEVKTDASDYCIAATLNQQVHPVAFFSWTLQNNENKHHAVEKEAAAIVEALRELQHFLIGEHFKIITDQKSISYMYDNKHKSEIKNDKINRWRVELSQYKFDIV